MPGHERNVSGPSSTTSQSSPSSSTARWHKIRPWSPHFILTIREITSVSATFVLSSTLSSNSSQDTDDIVAGNISDDDLEDSAADASIHVVSDALAKGLSVNVNAAPWKRSFIRMDDEGDEAIIILYGLMPGRQYDIELGIDSGDGEEIIHGQMVTQVKPQDEVVDKAEESASVFVSTVQSISQTADTPTVDEYAAQLRAQINQLNAEHTLLAAQLKTTRRDSQKADAALRSEIDAIRRACEKGATGELRARQRTLALQEAVKQAHSAASEAKSAVAQTESELPALREEEQSVERIHTEAKRDLERAEEEKDEALRSDKRRVADLRAELAALDTRVEKLTTKRDKLRKDTLPLLEKEVERVGREVELVERDADGFEVVDRGPVMFGVDLSPQRHGVPAANGSHGNADGYVLKPTYPTVAHATFAPTNTRLATSTSALPSSSQTKSQMAQTGIDMGGKSHAISSTLSSMAAPFDPNVGFGHRLNTSPSSGSNTFGVIGGAVPSEKGSRTPPQFEGNAAGDSRPVSRGAHCMPPPGLVKRTHSSIVGQHQTSHVHTQSWDVNVGLSPQANASAARRPPSPVRQTSLPSHVPQVWGEASTRRGGR